MELLLWRKIKNGQWVTLTHFPDGEVGITMDEAVRLKLVKGPGWGMGKLEGSFFHAGDGRFLVLNDWTDAINAYRERCRRMQK